MVLVASEKLQNNKQFIRMRLALMDWLSSYNPFANITKVHFVINEQVYQLCV
ncbi:MAG: hypothetical protein K0R28_2628 [Paenibacillus sp.]|nr:hypothetical protein [Paenibacillus sp.]